jgi:hypothetical protein
MSPATIDRLLKRQLLRPSHAVHRKPAAQQSLKAQVPLKTWSEWRDVRPGQIQADLVLHCGEYLAGFYLTTLTAVDVATHWITLRPVWGLGKTRVGTAMHLIRQSLPFPLQALHTDNGSEFINETLVPWCQREGIRHTRGRPYRKNDQAWVEQRNWQSVRRQVGYGRYDDKAAYALMEKLYHLLCLQLNFFRPVRKLVAKQRQGAKLIKRYDEAATPYQRLIASGCLDQQVKSDLEAVFNKLNPADLQRKIEKLLRQLWATTNHQKGADLAHVG